MATGHDYQAEYERRLHRVLAYIDAHLDEQIDLARLAKEASFSAFHFHRIFAAYVGETLGNYLTRRRVEQGATRLASQPQLSVLSVALAVGFGSPEAFSRAFKKHFGCSPRAWKDRPPGEWIEKSKMGQVDRSLSQETQTAGVYSSGMATQSAPPLNVTVSTRPSVRIAYLRYQGPFGKPAGRFWEEKVMPWLVANDLIRSPKYGVALDDPEVTHPTKCRYDAGAEVGKDYVPPKGAHVADLQGGLYAVTRFRGTGEQIPHVWQRFLREWLPSSGYQIDARPCYEYYPTDENKDNEGCDFTCDLCIPIAKL